MEGQYYSNMIRDFIKNIQKGTKDNVSYGPEKTIQGICKATDAIEPCYGAAGANVNVEEGAYPYHRVTNDAKIIVDALKFDDPYEQIGKNIIAEAGDRADKDSGDGRKTTMILTKAIFLESYKERGNPNDIRKSLKECIPFLHAAIDAEEKRDIGIDEIKSVATISSESEEIGQMIQNIYTEIGKDGIIEVDNSNLPETFYEITEGVRLRGAKAFGTYSYTEAGKAVWKNPSILISKEKITSVDQLTPIVEKMVEVGKNELVIYCEDIDMSVASRLAITHMQGGFKTLIIKSPILWKDWIYEDFAIMTGATVVNAKEGITFNNFNLSSLGTCEKIISNDSETRVIGIKDISAHIKTLQEKALTDDQQKIRISWLQTKVAILKVGAPSDSELSLISKKAKDACAAAYLALKDGVVVGGGICLFNLVNHLPNTVGGRILKRALVAPARQIAKNAGRDFDRMMVGGDFGYDSKNDQIVDMWDAGIMDPAIVIKNAIKNAISIASTQMSVHGTIKLNKHENIRQMPHM